MNYGAVSYHTECIDEMIAEVEELLEMIEDNPELRDTEEYNQAIEWLSGGKKLFEDLASRMGSVLREAHN